jgi:hypothetical protein
VKDKIIYKEEPKVENKEKDKEKKNEKNIFSMKDKDFEELKNYKSNSKQTEIKINNTNKKGQRNADSRLRSTEKSSFVDNKLDTVNKKFFRAQSSSFKFFQVKNKLIESSAVKNLSTEKKNNISVVDRFNKKK